MYNTPVMKNIIKNLLENPAMCDWTVDGISENEATISVTFEDEECIYARFFRGSNIVKIKIFDKDYHITGDEMVLIGRAADSCSKL